MPKEGCRGCATILGTLISSYPHQRNHCRTPHSTFSGFKFWGLTCPRSCRSCPRREWCTQVYSPSGNRIGMVMIPVTPALGQRNGWSSLDRIRCLIDGYEMGAQFGVPVWSIGTIDPHYRTSGNGGAAEAQVRWSKLPNLIRAYLCGCVANVVAGCNGRLWGRGGTLTFIREWQLAAT